MNKAHGAPIAGLLLAIAVATNELVFANSMAAGQAGNPRRPILPKEWRLDNNERDTFGQAPLGDYMGIPFNEAGRVRSDTTPESIWERWSTSAGRTPRRTSGAASAARGFSRSRTR